MPGLDLWAFRSDGCEFPVEVSLAGIEMEDGVQAIAAIRDVSDRERSRRRFEQFLEFAPDRILAIADDGRIILVNAKAEALFGYERHELVGRGSRCS